MVVGRKVKCEFTKGSMSEMMAMELPVMENFELIEFVVAW
jgi:hypothetical protein